MLIRRLEIQNFFCFLGPHLFDFTEGLNVISAKNGGGKSQIFNALYWTFFDKIYAEERSGASGKKSWQQAKVDALVPDFLRDSNGEDLDFPTTVTVVLDANDFRSSDGDAVRYTFTKQVVFRRRDGKVTNHLPAELTVEYHSDGETHFVSRAEHETLLDRIFPKSIRKFMWYQGETMEDLYDFSNNLTLRNAINEISYFPKYDFMDRAVKASERSISKKIEKELLKQDKVSRDQEQVYRDIQTLEKNIEAREKQLDQLRQDINGLGDEITNVESKLAGFDGFMKVKLELNDLDYQLRKHNDDLEASQVSEKERFITKWMLNQCGPLIEASKANLEILHSELQQATGGKNPVPNSLPGPEYVEQMLTDKICYICERAIEDHSPAFDALTKRIGDFQRNERNKLMEENYTELNKFRRRILAEVKPIEEEIKASRKTQSDLLKKRNAVRNKINNIYAELGTDDKSDLEKGAKVASELTNKLKYFHLEIDRKRKHVTNIEIELANEKRNLEEKKKVRDSFVKVVDANLIEGIAGKYIKMFVVAIGKLKANAYEKLIDEIEKESNRLYSLYLGGKQQGRILVRENGVQVVDMDTEIPLKDLNTGELVAQKLAVANSFLSLSAQKMHRSYPLIADAPSSDLDQDNTLNLTRNIGKSFDQIFIMSKDYLQFEGDSLASLIQDAGISSFYLLENTLIDPNGGNSRANRQSIPRRIK